MSVFYPSRTAHIVGAQTLAFLVGSGIIELSMTLLWIVAIIVNIFLARIFYLGLREKYDSGASIKFEIVVLSLTYIPVLLMVIYYLVYGESPPWKN